MQISKAFIHFTRQQSSYNLLDLHFSIIAIKAELLSGK